MSRRLIPLLVGCLVSAQAVADIARCHALDDRGQPEARDCYLTLLQTETNEAVRAEAYWRLGNLSQANAAFRRAVTANPENPNLKARWGMLFLAAHQAGDAEALFGEALAIDPENVGALLGQAELLMDRFSGPADAAIGEILALDPGNGRARLLRARLLLESGDRDGAADLLLDLVAPGSDAGVRDQLDAMALLAAADHLSSIADPDTPSPWVGRALEVNPRFGDVHAVPAYFYVITRRYREAVALLEQAVAIEPENWDARLELGTNLLRVNRIEEGRAQLRAAYEGDAFNAETVNTLRLLDTLADFDEQASDRLILRAHPDEAAVIAPYVGALVDRAVEEMASRYDFNFERPVVLELYQHHDDFAVRTAGLPGIGILGATFGDVVVMDGPAAKPADEWDWLSAVWHEIAHVVTLNATDNLVSRWFSEGVSVYEEQRFGPSPNASVPLDFLAAYSEGKLLPVAELDNGFMRPEYENQIGVSYVQAGLLCTFIADTYEKGLTRVLAAYATGADTIAAIETGLGIETSELDEGFMAWLAKTYGPAAEGLADHKAQTQAAFQALSEERWADARQAAEAAMAIYPAYVGPMNPALARARALEKSGNAVDLVEARASLLDYFDRGGRDPGALAHGVQLFEDAGETEPAYKLQRMLTRLDPLKLEHHTKLGALASALGRHQEALTEYRAVLALNPHDRATAYFNVATALNALGEKDAAQRALLQALEIAPRYPEGLKLLREIGR